MSGDFDCSSLSDMDVKTSVQSWSSSTGVYTKGHKRVKLWHREETNQKNTLNVIDYSDPFAVNHMLDKIDGGKYGSATKQVEALITRDRQFRGRLISVFPSLGKLLNNIESDSRKEVSEPASKLLTKPSCSSGENDVIDLDDDGDNDDSKIGTDAPTSKVDQPVVIVDSDEEDLKEKEWKPSNLFQEIVLSTEAGKLLLTNAEHNDDKLTQSNGIHHEAKDKGVYVGVDDEEDDSSNAQDDGLGDIWNEMNFVLECSKDVEEDHSWDDFLMEDQDDEEEEESCVHSFVLKDDLGYVCRICGVIDKSIETIVEFQYGKAKRSTRTYASDTRHNRDLDSSGLDGVRINQVNFAATEIAAHPRHSKQMKPHQGEGFNFLVSNLVSDNPGGCILAHAPGSGKTFMIISFMQSFLAKYPNAKPLVVLPKGILTTWKKEFQIWQVEDIPLLDFYTRKADTRAQQLEVLKQWYDQKSILFLGYKQFSTIICDGSNEDARSCQNLLLQGPSILILDEGHTPRNEDTDVLQSLAKVQTPRKVVLSGTLYQNHVKEVFNILNLVRPKFLKMETSRLAIKRIMSRVHISGGRKLSKAGGDAAFYDLVEETLQQDSDFKRKVNVIQDLREMTSKVLHYYKGDFLDELPGLVDYTVVLNLTPKQRHEVDKIKRLSRAIKLSSVMSSVTLHPKLNELPEISSTTNAMMDEFLEKEDFRQGVKAKFFLHMLNLCEYAGEKLLVFSQYLIPLKYLERLVTRVKGWALEREIFVISGDTSSEQRELSMDRFNDSPDAKVFFGSIKACGEGISLVGASRIIILDVHLNPSVTRQAIGRAFRPGQKKKVFAYRLVASDSPEEEFHNTCFRKELISKLWFEWNEYCGTRAFEVETLDVKNCGDSFFESSKLREDVKALYKR